MPAKCRKPAERNVDFFIDEYSLPGEDPAGCRQRMEIAAARWLAEHAEELSDIAVRFDLIALMAIDDKRALLRHHINALGCGEFADSAD